MKTIRALLSTAVLASGLTGALAFGGPGQDQTTPPATSPSTPDQPSGSKAPSKGDQSPDTNQENSAKNNKKNDSTAPTGTPVPPAGQSPDIQQEKNAPNGHDKGSKHHKTKNNAKQAHGTPQPQSDTQH